MKIKCRLCGYEFEGENEGCGLCYQCWIGEIENPEHKLEE